MTTIGEWMMRSIAKHFIECAETTHGNRALFIVKGKWEHHREYSSGYMQAERRGRLVGTYNSKATVEQVLEDMRCEVGR